MVAGGTHGADVRSILGGIRHGDQRVAEFAVGDHPGIALGKLSRCHLFIGGIPRGEPNACFEIHPLLIDIQRRGKIPGHPFLHLLDQRRPLGRYIVEQDMETRRLGAAVVVKANHDLVSPLADIEGQTLWLPQLRLAGLNLMNLFAVVPHRQRHVTAQIHVHRAGKLGFELPTMKDARMPGQLQVIRLPGRHRAFILPNAAAVGLLCPKIQLG